MHKIYLYEHLNLFLKKIKQNDNFTLINYQSEDINLIQKNTLNDTYTKIFQKELKNIMNLTYKHIYHAIPSPCCDRSSYYWFASRIKSKQITFANLFINTKHNQFVKNLQTTKRTAIIIGNNIIADKKAFNLDVLKYYPIENTNYINFFSNKLTPLLNKIIQDFGKYNNLLYLISAGPLSKIIIYNLYKNNPNNCYIDLELPTNQYTSINHNCWIFDPLSTNFNVSVILTLFKKPDSLQKQVNSILKQTLKPKEILLFQDGITEPYKICIDTQLLNIFSKHKANPTNGGVWERFKFAKEAASPYICIFDDDTIPGKKWLENCHYNMMFNEGIYGTVGIILKNLDDYPYKNYYKVGWIQPFSEKTTVDFVGHSWFIKKDYLYYMLSNTEQYQAYKYVAEDMCLSFKCKEHGIPTYVPPHPYTDTELWGSQKKYAYKFGLSTAAISMNSTNFINMNKALHQFKKEGFESLYQNNKNYVKNIYNKIKYEELIYSSNKYKGFKAIKHKIKYFIKKIILQQKISILNYQTKHNNSFFKF